MCGIDLELFELEKANIIITHDTSQIAVSHQEAEKLERETGMRLLKEKKLSLILDLDQTIIQATTQPQERKEDIYSFILPESPTVYYVKLRPGWKKFLETAFVYFELYIYTMGTRHYANAVANVLDPKQHLFKHRILSRDESGSVTRKKLERLFPCDTSMVVVIDDRADVWEWSPNLIKVVPCTFYF